MTEENESASNESSSPKTEAAKGFSSDYVRELREENKSYRLAKAELERKLEEQAAELTKTVTAKDAELSGLKADYRSRLARHKIENLAVKAGVVDVDVLKMLDDSAFTYGEDDQINNADDLLKSFKETKPHFFGSTNTASTEKAPPPAKQEGNAKATDAEWEAQKKQLGWS